MRIRNARLVAGLAGLVVVGCVPGDPPTVTPAPQPSPVATGASVIEITVGPPVVPGGPMPVPAGPIAIAELVAYRDAAGAFSMSVPPGWVETRQPLGQPGTDVRLGTLFQAPGGTGLISVTQFDNGQVPTGLGRTANQVLELAGVLDQAGYQEVGREDVIERPDEAMRVEMTYARSNGVPMHSLVLFQIDGTTFSMVHAGVERTSWDENEARIREILDSYTVPAPPAAP